MSDDKERISIEVFYHEAIGTVDDVFLLVFKVEDFPLIPLKRCWPLSFDEHVDVSHGWW